MECPHGCSTEGNCCDCCICVANLSEDEIREMRVQEEYLRIETDTAYKEEQFARYHSQTQQSTRSTED